jgi:hypothetical protein
MADVKTAARLALELSKLDPAELNTIVGLADELRKHNAPVVKKSHKKKEAAGASAAPSATGKKRGRPKGTKNPPKEQVAAPVQVPAEPEQESLPMEGEEQEQTH